jgi:formimidoylglutamate deiminase
MIESGLRRKVAWLIAIRAIISTILLGSAIVTQITAPGSFAVDPFFFLIGLTYALTITFALTVRYVDEYRWLVDVQLAGDALIVSAFIYVTGGITSYFTSLYVLPIVAASTVQFRRGGMLVATLSTVLYVGLAVAQYMAASGLLNYPWLTRDALALPSPSVARYTVALNVFGFFAVALLSGSLADSLKSAGARLQQASTQIADLRALNQHVIDSLPSGLATTDQSDRILTFNRAAQAITGVSFQSAVGRPIGEVMRLPAPVNDAIHHGLREPGTRRHEFWFRSPDGRGDIEVGLSATHLETPGGRAGFLFTFQDVTSIKKLERDAAIQQRLAAVGEMAAGIAHEIRNPLTVIKMLFHSLDRRVLWSDATAADDPNLLAKEVIRAANDLGLRIALLRVAYARSGFQAEVNPRQVRFIESDPESYLKNLESLISDLGVGEVSEDSSSGVALPYGRASDTAWVGLAPHSVRAVPLDYLRAVIGYANEHDLKTHMHVAEQPAEVSACVEEYGRTPVALLESEGLLSPRFTAVHAIHVTPKAIASVAKSGVVICACPTTERNLGDGVVPANEYQKHGVSICLGTDSHAQIDLLEDARELEYHLRLQKLERAVLSLRSPDNALTHGAASDTARYLFDCATINGAQSLGASGGTLASGKPADFFTVDLDDPSIAGASPDDLLPGIVFTLSRGAVREVVIGGKPIVSEGRHLIQEDVVERFNDLQNKLWG